jgi:hypothetical protein
VEEGASVMIRIIEPLFWAAYLLAGIIFVVVL